MSRMLHRLFETALRLRGNARDAIRKDLTTIVQETLENADIPIIEIGDATQFQRVNLLLGRVTTIVTLVRVVALTTALKAAISSALSGTVWTAS